MMARYTSHRFRLVQSEVHVAVFYLNLLATQIVKNTIMTEIGEFVVIRAIHEVAKAILKSCSDFFLLSTKHGDVTAATNGPKIKHDYFILREQYMRHTHTYKLTNVHKDS